MVVVISDQTQIEEIRSSRHRPRTPWQIPPSSVHPPSGSRRPRQLVAGVEDGDLARATLCSGLDVAALRTHVLGWLELFGRCFSDGGERAGRPDPQTFETPADPAVVVRTARGRFATSLDAGVLAQEVVMPSSRMTGPARRGQRGDLPYDYEPACDRWITLGSDAQEGSGVTRSSRTRTRADDALPRPMIVFCWPVALP
jgi:hypothetical protein